MKKASEYQAHADECRLLATKMASGEQRDQLLDMARHWEDLARDRLALLRQQELAAPADRKDATGAAAAEPAPG